MFHANLNARGRSFLVAGAALAVVACGLALRRVARAAEPITVLLCDGETTAQVDTSKPLTTEDGQAVADQLMARWLAKNPQADWETRVREQHRIVPAADNSHLISNDDTQFGTWSRITELDVLTWKRETEKLVVEGAAVFHDAGRLGSTIAVSCDMCHPDASNTHPETYPKYQSQLGRVALMRDMINWCVEHPVRGKKFEPDSAEMQALEAYILAQRKGTPLEYGKH